MPPKRPAAEPSISHTSTGKVRNGSGQMLNGGSASVVTAPARNAMSARRQPQASMIEWAMRASLHGLRGAFEGGSSGESFTDASRLTGRSDGAAWC